MNRFCWIMVGHTFAQSGLDRKTDQVSLTRPRSPTPRICELTKVELIRQVLTVDLSDGKSNDHIPGEVDPVGEKRIRRGEAPVSLGE